jgi:CMP-N-acetylneuraminic acid synthetase
VSRPICLIPAKERSRRLPGKNVALLRGKPLLAYSVEAALQSGVFSRVIVSTDSEVVAEVARRSGAEVPGLRAPELAADTAGVVDVCLDLLDRLEREGAPCEALGVMLTTTPLRTADDVRGAWKRFAETGADFLMAVTTYDIPPHWALTERGGYLEPLFDADYLFTDKSLPPAVVDNGAIYLTRVAAFRKHRNFYGPREGGHLVGYSMPRDRSVDVDEPFDLFLAEAILERRARGDAS